MKFILKYVCASLLGLLPGMISAQTPAQSPEQQSDECLVFNVDYSMGGSASAKISGSATVTVQGDAYHMNGNGIEAWCDGVSIWMIDNEAKEVYVESAESASESYMQNPSRALRELKGKSEGTYVLDDGRKVHIKVNSIKKSDRKDISSFRPTQDFDSSWVVTDLR